MSCQSHFGEFAREIQALPDHGAAEPVIITHHGRDDAVLLAVEDYARLCRHEQKTFHLSQLLREVVDERDTVPVPAIPIGKNPPAWKPGKEEKDQER